MSKTKSKSPVPSKWISSQYGWCRLDMWVQETSSGWYAMVKDILFNATAGPFPTRREAEKALVKELNKIADEAKNYELYELDA